MGRHSCGGLAHDRRRPATHTGSGSAWPVCMEATCFCSAIRFGRRSRVLRRRFTISIRWSVTALYTASLLRAGFPDVANVHVAPLGVDAQWFDEPSLEATEAYQRRIGWSLGERVVLTVARLDERKGHLATLASLARLPESERKNIKYVCVGRAEDKAYEARIVATAASLGVPHGSSRDLAGAELLAAYRTASVLALCGQNILQEVEGFGLELLEGAAQAARQW